MDPELVNLIRAGPSERLRRWRAAPEADRFAWYLMLLDRCAVQAWTLEATRTALRRGDCLTSDEIEGLRSSHAFSTVGCREGNENPGATSSAVLWRLS